MVCGAYWPTSSICTWIQTIAASYVAFVVPKPVAFEVDFGNGQSKTVAKPKRILVCQLSFNIKLGSATLT